MRSELSDGYSKTLDLFSLSHLIWLCWELYGFGRPISLKKYLILQIAPFCPTNLIVIMTKHFYVSFNRVKLSTRLCISMLHGNKWRLSSDTCTDLALFNSAIVNEPIRSLQSQTQRAIKHNYSNI